MSSKFEFNLEGLRELMKSPAMQGQLEQAGQMAVNTADSSCPGYATDTHIAPFTAVCTVYPSTREAGLDNYLNNTLLKAVQGTGLSMR
jgi:hypothetical protein